MNFKMNASRGLISEQQNELSISEYGISNMQKRLDEIFLFKGTISSKVENGLFICTEIDFSQLLKSIFFLMIIFNQYILIQFFLAYSFDG